MIFVYNYLVLVCLRNGDFLVCGCCFYLAMISLLFGNDFSTSIISFARDAFQHLSALHILSLHFDNIVDDGAAAISASLHHLQHLHVLILTGNEISNVGLIPFLQLGLTLPAPPPASLSLATQPSLLCMSSRQKRSSDVPSYKSRVMKS